MRILLDEDVDVRLRQQFSDALEVETVQFQGWKGLTNGELLDAASRIFDVLVTMDNSLPEQQNLPAYDISVLVLRPRSKNLEDLVEVISEAECLLPRLQPGEARRVHPPR